MGRLTRDPEIRYSQGERQMAIARYTLAVDRRSRGTQGQNGEQNTDFIPCVAFKKAAEFAERYLRQGMRVLVSGRIQTGSYTNQDGQRVYTTEIVIEDQEFADSRNAGNQEQVSQPRPVPAPSSDDGFMNIPDNVDDEGLPFA